MTSRLSRAIATGALAAGLTVAGAVVPTASDASNLPKCGGYEYKSYAVSGVRLYVYRTAVDGFCIFVHKAAGKYAERGGGEFGSASVHTPHYTTKSEYSSGAYTTVRVGDCVRWSVGRGNSKGQGLGDSGEYCNMLG